MVENEKALGFWRRQFGSQTRPLQITFDVVMGIVAPIFCLVYDPFVFHVDNYTGPFLYDIRLFAYTSIGLGILTLLVWFLAGPHLNSLSGFFAAIFFYGVVFAVGIGIILFPFSLLGLFFFFGVFGFVPFVSAFVFFRNGIKAFRKANEHRSKGWVAISSVFGIILIIVIPVGIQLLSST